MAVVLAAGIGLPTSSAAANPWELCLYRGSLRPDFVRAHEQWLGRPVDGVLEFIPLDSWSSISRPTNQLRTWDDLPYDVVFTTPMLPRDGSTLAAGASGAYDAHWRTFAETFVREGRPDARIRLGHEGNHTFYPWTATGGREAQFAAYYRRIVTVLRSVPGTRFRFTWNVLSNGQQADVERMYPGDAYVDVVSLDLYDGVPDVKDFEQRWQRLRTQKYGIDWLRAFAGAHGKPMAFDEWALIKSTNHEQRDPRTDSGDDTVFINRMLDLFDGERVAYACYFDVDTKHGWTNSRIMNGPYPNASAAYRSRLARTSATSTPTTARPTTSTTSTVAGVVDDVVSLIVGDAEKLPPNDGPLVDRLVTQGWTVRLVDDDAIDEAALRASQLVVLSSSVVPTKVPPTLGALPVPLLGLEAYAQTTLGMASSGREHDDLSALRIVDPSHPIAAGRAGDVLVQGAVSLGVGTPAPGAQVIARAPGATSASIYAVERGAALTSGPSPARRVGFFFSYDSPAALSAHGWALFDAAITWLAS